MIRRRREGGGDKEDGNEDEKEVRLSPLVTHQTYLSMNVLGCS